MLRLICIIKQSSEAIVLDLKCFQKMIHIGSAGQGLMSLTGEGKLPCLQLCSPFIMLCLGSIVMYSVIYYAQ